MKVLFITSTRLGDAVLSTGLLDYLLRTYPEAKVTVACGPLPQSLFEGFANVERIIPLQKQKRHRHWIKLWKAVVGTRWDMVIDLRDSAVSRLIRANKRFVFGKTIDKSKHKVEQAAQVMKLSEVPAPKLYFTEKQNNFANALINNTSSCDLIAGSEKKEEDPSVKPKDDRFKNFPIIAIGPSANWIGKTWPAENFIKLIQWMTSEEGILPRARVAIFAAPGEEAQALPVLNSIPEHQRIDGIAKGNPAEVAACLARCDFYVGNDSGLMHAAAACGVPTVGLFGPSYPHLYAPYGVHTTYARTPETFDQLIDFEGYAPEKLTRTLMQSLSVEQVIDTIKRHRQSRIAC
ncbi:MAG: glycosyltransferase family 9 protein [Alphaproteobacteria bacterium]|nr:glycosyltransferase family 9 protein [Alphaproteobacteria bacterium]